MLFSLTRPVTPESSWVPGRLPRPTRHPIGFFFLRRTHKYRSMVISFIFFRRTHKYCCMVVGFFFLRYIHKYSSFRPPFFLHFNHGSLKKLSLRRRAWIESP